MPSRHARACPGPDPGSSMAKRSSMATIRYPGGIPDMTGRFSRRSVIAGASALGSAAIIVKPGRAADYKFAQYHNQAATGTLHKNLVAMWDAVRTETNGRVETEVFAENNKIAGGDPVALKMLIAGEIQFFTLMGGIIGTV